MKYPRYPRRFDRRYKLSKEDIIDIKNTHNLNQQELANWYQVSQARISQILQPIEEQKRRNKEHYRRYRDLYYRYTKEQRRRIRARKRMLQLRQVQDYYNQKTKVYRKRLCRAFEMARKE